MTVDHEIHAQVIAGYRRRWWRWLFDSDWRQMAHIYAYLTSTRTSRVQDLVERNVGAECARRVDTKS